jgi:hypothetical protein|tara:strand:+ start:468 stop:986 length:519 start_codon:yes stop_codon:yes gene_type:complete
MKIFRAVWTALLIAFISNAVVASESKQIALSKETLIFEQRSILIEHHPNIKDGSVGHVLYFEGELYFEDGKRAGILYGSTASIDITRDDGQPEVRHRNLIFVINGSQIIASGISGYSNKPKWQNKDHEWHHLDLAIVGGTGKYMGAFGSIKSKKLKDNKFQHTLEMYRPLHD